MMDNGTVPHVLLWIGLLGYSLIINGIVRLGFHDS